MRGLAVFLGLTALACSGGKDAEGDDSGAVTEPVVDGGTGVCSTWTGFVAGRTWRYATDSAAATQAEWRDTVTTLDADGAVSLHQELLQTTSGTTYTSVTDTQYRCEPDGLWLLGTQSAWVSTVDGVETEGWLDGTWTAEGPVQPRGLAVGTRWEWAYDYSYTASYGDSADSGRVETEVEASAPISVPAGEYAAVQLFQTTESGASLRSWVADGVGLVANESVELVAVYE